MFMLCSSFQLCKKNHLLFLLVIFLSFNVNAQSSVTSIKENIKNAETYYWLGMAEKGNMQAFNKGLEYIKNAETFLNSLELNDSIKTNFNSKIFQLHSDIEAQADIAHDTFYGFFPLVRFLNSVLFLDSEAFDSYELIDDPDIVAVTKEVETLYNNFLRDFKQDIQIEVLFTSFPKNYSYENEVKYIFNQSPKFWVNNFKLEDALTPLEIVEMASGKSADSTLNKIKPHIEGTQFLLVSIKEINQVDDIYYFQIEGRLFQIWLKNELQNSKVMSFVRDRTMFYYPMWFLNLFMLLLALLAIFISMKKYEENSNFFPKGFILAIITFFIGRFLPLIIVPVMSSFKPAPETLAILSFWWVILFTAAIFIGPLFVIKTAYSKFPFLFKGFVFDGKFEYILLAMNFGVLAYLLELIIIYHLPTLLILLTSLLFIVITSYFIYILGKSIDRGGELPISFAIFSVLFLVIFSALSFSVKLEYTFLGLIGFIIFPFLKKIKKIEKTVSQERKELLTSDFPRNNEELIKRISTPQYYCDYPDYNSIMNTIFSEQNNSAFKVIGFYGPAGVGKTAISNHIINVIQEKDENVIVLKGLCPEVNLINSEAVPFAPFQEAFKDVFHFNIFSPPDDQLKDLDDTFSEVVDSLIPLISFIFPNSSNSASVPASDEHQKILVKNTLVNMPPRNSALVLFFDDIQWLDNSSGKLLQYLIDKFKNDQRRKIYFIFSGRDRDDFNFLASDSSHLSIFELKPMDKANRINFLIKNLAVEDRVAEFIINQITEGDNSSGDFHLLMRIMEYLVRNNYFELNQETKSFDWVEQHKAIEKLPIPDDYKEIIRKQITEYPQYKTILYGAACIGKDFNITLLADSIEIPKLKCLEILQEIEETTGLVIDNIEEDDFYSFKSTFLLEVLNDEMKANPNNYERKQLIKEYHKKIAQNLEKSIKDNPSLVFEIANHYSLSGISNSEKAILYSLKAAIASLKIYQFSSSVKFYEQAKEIAKRSNNKSRFELEFLLFECELSHLTGTLDKKELGNKCNNFIKTNNEISFENKLVVCRAFYEAELFDNCLVLSEEIIDRAKNNKIIAEAYQFKGLSCSDHKEKLNFLYKGYQVLLNELLPQYSEGTITNEEFEKFIGVKTINQLESEKLRLLSRITDSIASVLNNLFSEKVKKKEADLKGLQQIVHYYMRSLFIKKLNAINDKKGQAMTTGGLGRMYLAAYEIDHSENHIKLAAEYFNEDLTISREIGDQFGEMIMLNCLGNCMILMGNFESAKDYYLLSETLSKNPIDYLFVYKGYFFINLLQNKMEEVNTNWSSILELLKGNKNLEWFKDSEMIPLIKEIENEDYKGKLLNDIEKLYSN